MKEYSGGSDGNVGSFLAWQDSTAAEGPWMPVDAILAGHRAPLQLGARMRHGKTCLLEGQFQKLCVREVGRMRVWKPGTWPAAHGHVCTLSTHM